MRQRKGFTLLELLVVIGIISLLLSLLVVLIKNMVTKARVTKTATLIKVLSEGCSRYRVETGGFPPQSPYSDSRCLHFYLGKELRIVTGRDLDGKALGYKTLPPIVPFKADMLDLPSGQETLDPVVRPPVPVIDAWGNPILYRPYPGQQNPSAVDIWSTGNDQTAPEDDITNWNKEF
jgi:prepilin-type N-terminal cleavage/methylation domain-containing protein